MPGKPGMTGPGLGGKREGAGRPFTKFIARRDEHFIVERSTIGGAIQQDELWRVLSVSADEIEFQYGNDIIVIRRPDEDDNIIDSGESNMDERTHYVFRIEFIDDDGETVVREVVARHAFEAKQLAGAFNKVVLSVINCDL